MLDSDGTTKSDLTDDIEMRTSTSTSTSTSTRNAKTRIRIPERDRDRDRDIDRDRDRNRDQYQYQYQHQHYIYRKSDDREQGQGYPEGEGERERERIRTRTRQRERQGEGSSMITSRMPCLSVRFLFPYLLGVISGVLIMYALILINPSLHQLLHHTDYININTNTAPCITYANTNTNTNTDTNTNDPNDSTQRFKSMLTKSTDSIPISIANAAAAAAAGPTCPTCPLRSCPACACASGGMIRACPACPPPVCSTASAGVLNRKRGMPRWSRWMRDTFLGHMVNNTDVWLKKPDQIPYQLNYLIDREANFDNVQKLRFLDPFLDGVTDRALANARWLTVADGYFGMEGAYVYRRARDLRRAHVDLNIPNIHVTGTALSNMTLRYALKYGYVDAISEENVEDLSFDDESFDYVLIKEAFHHLTRPYLGLYELLRVARHGVILIEPSEIIGRPPSYWSSNPPYARSLVLPDVRLGFESSLIQFRLSVHELQKVAMALNLPAVAVKGINNPLHAIHNKTQYFRELQLLEQLGLEGKRPFNLVAAVVFKQQPSKTLQDSMIKDHFLFLDVPYTPFPYDDYSVANNS